MPIHSRVKFQTNTLRSSSGTTQPESHLIAGHDQNAFMVDLQFSLWWTIRASRVPVTWPNPLLMILLAPDGLGPGLMDSGWIPAPLPQ
jgi:hypothetical protein